MILSAALLAVALGVKRFRPAFPASLVVLGVALVIAAATDLEAHGIAVIGEVNGGLPPFGCHARERRTSSICCFQRERSRSSPSPT